MSSNINLPQWFMTSALKGRGWTDGLIKRFLPEPDETKINWHYKSGPPVRLYAIERVTAIEQSAEFQEAIKAGTARRQGAAKAVETKRRKMQEYLESVVIEVPELDDEELLREAIAHYNAGNPGDLGASTGSNRAFLDRITVNYLRHMLTRYEEELEAIGGRVGAKDAYLEISAKVFDAISDVYPYLGSECRRQMDRRIDEHDG